MQAQKEIVVILSFKPRCFRLRTLQNEKKKRKSLFHTLRQLRKALSKKHFLRTQAGRQMMILEPISPHMFKQLPELPRFPQRHQG